METLKPVLVTRGANTIRDHVHYRMTEIYRAFTFGLWMSAIALTRSLVEFCLRDNAHRFDVELTDPSGNEKTLKRLGEEMATHIQDLAEHVDRVRDTANRILHPKKRGVIAFPKVMRKEALECLESARTVVELLYR